MNLKKIFSIFIIFSLIYGSVGLYMTRISYAQSEGGGNNGGGNNNGGNLPQTSQGDGDIADCFRALGLGAVEDAIIGAISGAIDSGLSAITGGLIGGEKAVKDSGVRTQTTKANIKSCIKGIKDQLLRVALVRFKKQLLDRITDDTIAWINGDNPKYVTDFGKLLSDSADAAIGETLTELGGAGVCKPLRFSLNLKLSRQTTPFTRRVSCTLGDVVNNIDNFRQNFSSGGWIGYSEILKPRNNPFGVAFLTQQEIWKKDQKKSEAQFIETTANGDFKPIKQCTEWGAYAYTTNNGISSEQEITEIGSPQLSEPLSPETPPTPPPVITPDLRKKYTPVGGGQLMPYWKCKNSKITNPASLVRAPSTKAVTQDSDYLINSNDLNPYISAIFDAAINRLIKSGARGLKSVFIKSDTGAGRQPTPYNKEKDGNLINAGKDYRNSTNQKNKLKMELTNLLASSTPLINEASSTLQEVIDLTMDLSSSASSTTGYKLLGCEAVRLAGNNSCPRTNKVVNFADESLNQFILEKTNLVNIKNLINQIKNTIDSLSEDGLLSALSSVNSAINGLKSRTLTLKRIKTELESAQKALLENLSQCKNMNEVYICSNEPQT